MSSSTESRQRAIALIEQLSETRLPAVVQLLELLSSPVEQQVRIQEESRLLKKIEQQLPEAEQAQLDDLRQRCEWEQLTDEEHQALIRYEDHQEQFRVDRLSALIELTKLKGLDLIDLNRTLQPDSRTENQSNNAA
ncbi:MAG: hypothetical protein AAFR12_10420 [Cyanobacteria bacterium J06626_6]